MELATQLDLHSIILEVDALMIVRALTKEEECWSLYGQVVVNDIARAKLKCFNEWNVQHYNMLAELLMELHIA